jgi:hypothetical protein
MVLPQPLDAVRTLDMQLWLQDSVITTTELNAGHSSDRLRFTL